MSKGSPSSAAVAGTSGAIGAPRFVTAYGPKARLRHVTPPGVGRTKQSFKDECDINNIMKRFQ